jgi:hypothetical protein
MPTFTTSFSEPPAITGLVATPDPDLSAVALTWDATTLGAAFWRFYVYRENALGEFERIGESETNAFTDFEAPHGTAQYAVTQSNGWAESDPVSASTLLNLDYWIVDPLNPGASFSVPHVITDSARHDPQAERFAPLGRPAAVVVDGGRLAPDGTISARVLSYEDTIARILRAGERRPYVLWKNPWGEVRRIRIGEVREERGGSATRVVTADYTTVD